MKEANSFASFVRHYGSQQGLRFQVHEAFGIVSRGMIKGSSGKGERLTRLGPRLSIWALVGIGRISDDNFAAIHHCLSFGCRNF